MPGAGAPGPAFSPGPAGLGQDAPGASGLRPASQPGEREYRRLFLAGPEKEPFLSTERDKVLSGSDSQTQAAQLGGSPACAAASPSARGAGAPGAAPPGQGLCSAGLWRGERCSAGRGKQASGAGACPEVRPGAPVGRADLGTPAPRPAQGASEFWAAWTPSVCSSPTALTSSLLSAPHTHPAPLVPPAPLAAPSGPSGLGFPEHPSAGERSLPVPLHHSIPHFLYGAYPDLKSSIHLVVAYSPTKVSAPPGQGPCCLIDTCRHSIN